MDRTGLDKKLEEMREAQQNFALAYDKEAEGFWQGLAYEDKLKAFYSVCKRIHKGEMEVNGTYRYVLYDIFGFGPDAYTIGMMCGYLDIHNAIVTKDEEDDTTKPSGTE